MLPIEEKESFRWLESLQNTNDTLLDKKITVVTVCDREADIYDFFLRSHKIQSPVLVRAKNNRIINKKSTYSRKSGEKLWSFMKKQMCQDLIQVKIPKKKSLLAWQLYSFRWRIEVFHKILKSGFYKIVDFW